MTSPAPAARPTQGAAHVFRTFDGLEVEPTGRKDGACSLADALGPRHHACRRRGKRRQLNARLPGWEFEIPDYKYAAIFVPVEELLKPATQPKKKAGAPPQRPSTSPP